MNNMDETDERRPKRQKRDSSYKSKAFEKFKRIKSGNRNKYEIEEVDNVYETVDEKEYLKTVSDRQADDWVVDDDGSGYYDDGRDIFDDDLDCESIANASSSMSKGVKRKKKAVSDKIQKGDLKRMLSKMPIKKKEEEKVSDDAMLSELLGQINGNDNHNLEGSSTHYSFDSLLNIKKAEKEYLRTFTPPPRKISLRKKTLERKSLPSTPKILQKIPHERQYESDEVQNMETMEDIPVEECNKEERENVQESIHTQNCSEIIKAQQTTGLCTDNTTVEFDDTENFFNDDLDFSQIEEFEYQQNYTNYDFGTVEDDILADFLDEQENYQSSEMDTSIGEVMNIDSTVLPLVESDEKKVFRFFYWDAYENAFVQPGVVFLFGKTFCEKTKSYASCSVVVKNVQRKLFVLPRPYVSIFPFIHCFRVSARVIFR